MRTEMKNARKQNGNAKGNNITRSVSMPNEMWPRIEARLRENEEMDFSKYIRSLIRRDLNAA
jgi:hypothetical protein